MTEEDAVNKVFGPRFLLERPLLDAVRAGDQAVLLIDEVDRADDEFEAFLLEVLSDFQISIPEIGTIKADRPPLVLLTSNRTRELHDALKRRCLYHWIGYPPPEREVEIVMVQAPGRVRGAGGQGRARRSTGSGRWNWPSHPASPRPSTGCGPWTSSARPGSSTEAAADTLGAVVKERDDLELVRDNLEEITSGA